MAAGFSITISAVDRASRTMDRINKRIEAMNAPARRFRKSFGRFLDATGLNRVAGAMRGFAAAGLLAARNLTRIIEPLGAITSIASVAGLYKLTTGWARFGSQLGFSAQRIGIMPDKLQAMQGAAEEAGSSAGSLTSGLTNLRDTMTNALGGRNPEALTYFKQMQIYIGEMNGTAVDATKILPQVADYITRLRDPTLQARVATELLGSAGEDLLPFLRLGSRGMAQYEADARRFGVTNLAGVKAANALRLSMARLDLATRGLGYSIAQQVEPALKPLLDWFTNLIAANREVIAARVGQAVKSFLAWMKGVNWTGIQQGINGVFGSVKNVVDSLGGWKQAGEDAAIGIGALYALPVLQGLASLVASLAQVAAAISSIRKAKAQNAAAENAGAGAEAATEGGAGAVEGAAAGGLAASLRGRVAQAASLARRTAGKGAWYFRTSAGRRALLGAFGRGLSYGARLSALSAITNMLIPEDLGTGDTTLRGKALPNDIASTARAAAIKNGVDPNRYLALLQTEGGGYDRTSNAGAFGPAQLMPDTARELGVATSASDPNYDWRANVEAGARYFRRQVDRFGQNYDAAEAAYNAGANGTGVQHFADTGDASQLPHETRRYVSSIDAETAMNRRMDDPDADAAHRNLKIAFEVNHTGMPSRDGPKINIRGVSMNGQTVRPRVARSMPDTSRGY